MRRLTRFTALVAWLALAACGDIPPAPDAAVPEAPEVAAALDWIDAADMEFGAAPFSPPGWPLKIGDGVNAPHRSEPQVSTTGHPTFLQLLDRFPDFLGIQAVNWVNDVPFGAFFTLTPGHRDWHWTYEGHYPDKIDRDFFEAVRGYGLDDLPLPPSGNVERALGNRLEQAAGVVLDSLDVLRARWHEPFQARYGKDGNR